MGIPTVTKFAIIATSCNMPAHVRINNCFYNHFFIKKNKQKINQYMK